LKNDPLKSKINGSRQRFILMQAAKRDEKILQGQLSYCSSLKCALKHLQIIAFGDFLSFLKIRLLTSGFKPILM
jgi:hypothetical protein